MDPGPPISRPSGPAPLHSALSGSAPPGAVPTGSAPPGSAPPGSAPPGSAPPGSAPPGSAPPGSTPLGSTPLGSAPLGSAPLGSAPPGTAPPGSAPQDSAPQDSAPLCSAPPCSAPPGLDTPGSAPSLSAPPDLALPDLALPDSTPPDSAPPDSAPTESAPSCMMTPSYVSFTAARWCGAAPEPTTSAGPRHPKRKRAASRKTRKEAEPQNDAVLGAAPVARTPEPRKRKFKIIETSSNSKARVSESRKTHKGRHKAPELQDDASPCAAPAHRTSEARTPDPMNPVLKASAEASISETRIAAAPRFCKRAVSLETYRETEPQDDFFPLSDMR
ncbi:basic proline-rich protein-like [Frankliniella occidentalis]|uniref:Basic proline-rich protein-like n=1 Tax=Frankliniella occidentalis TaxID=133901 RepID=A0A9C6U1X9_FRAOC|nr:basic proline-rich protein-like [Frankliniella occidentalis]